MKILLDTHLLLWVARDPDKLSAEALELLGSTENKLFFSVASLWEIAIKKGLGRSDFQVDARLLYRELLEHGYNELVISGEHAVMVDALPPIHKDPFDRILIAQAMKEGFLLLTKDAAIAKYPGPIHRV